MSMANFRKIIERFESTGTLGLQLGREHKRLKPQQIQEVATAFVVCEISNIQATTSVRAISHQTSIPYSTGLTISA